MSQNNGSKSSKEFLSLLLTLEQPQILGLAIMMGIKQLDNTDGVQLLQMMRVRFNELNRKQRKTVLWILRQANMSETKEKFWKATYKLLGKETSIAEMGNQEVQGFLDEESGVKHEHKLKSAQDSGVSAAVTKNGEDGDAAQEDENGTD